jgi:ribosome recycling factor
MSNKKVLEEFDEKFDQVEFLSGVPVNLPTKTQQEIKSFIDQKLTEQREEIVKWAKQRCEDNKRIHGTDKWNSDLEDLIKKLK